VADHIAGSGFDDVFIIATASDLPGDLLQRRAIACRSPVADVPSLQSRCGTPAARGMQRLPHDVPDQAAQGAILGSSRTLQRDAQIVVDRYGKLAAAWLLGHVRMPLKPSRGVRCCCRIMRGANFGGNVQPTLIKCPANLRKRLRSSEIRMRAYTAGSSAT